MPARPILSAVTWVALAAGLALPTVFPEAANILFLIASGLALVLSEEKAGWMDLIRRPGIALPLLAIALLCVAFALTASTPQHLFAAFYFLPLLMIFPLVALFERSGQIVTVETIGLSASVGAAGAAGVALVDSIILGEVRAGTLVNNPIHFAALALVVGFVALVGMSSKKPAVRLAVLVAPSLSLLAVVLSGSRGPMFAALPLAALAIALVIGRVSRQRALFALYCLAATAIIAVLIAWFTGVFQRFAVFAELPQLLTGGTTNDSSTSERLQIYSAAWRAFLDSPIFGHGLIDLTTPVLQYMPEGAVLGDYQHLHNDLADFAVAGGALGLAAYLLILVAPIVEVVRRGIWMRHPDALYLALVISTGFFCMGLTNATFGILSQTTLYAFVTALVVHLCRTDAQTLASAELTSSAAP
ncbi:O-antigen ligase family protein [Devosia sp.]|uniref:O-antigen ligase family protein n=1 Tax=Devosia sp. TaxID=1871048 RepID=UPI002FCADB81